MEENKASCRVTVVFIDLFHSTSVRNVSGRRFVFIRQEKGDGRFGSGTFQYWYIIVTCINRCYIVAAIFALHFQHVVSFGSVRTSFLLFDSISRLWKFKPIIGHLKAVERHVQLFLVFLKIKFSSGPSESSSSATNRATLFQTGVARKTVS